MPKSKRSPPSKSQLRQFQSYIKYNFLKKKSPIPLSDRKQLIENNMEDTIRAWKRVGRLGNFSNEQKRFMKKHLKIRGETDRNYLYRLALEEMSGITFQKNPTYAYDVLW